MAQEKKPQDFFAKLGTSIRAGAESLVQGTKELTALGKLKLEIVSLENERSKKLEEIGHEAYSLYKNGVQLPQELLSGFAAVDDLEARIAAKNKEIEDLRKDDKLKETPVSPVPEENKEKTQAFCTNCGAPVGPNDRFCASCGARLKE